MSIRIGFDALQPNDSMTLLAQHAFFGGPLLGLKHTAERRRLFKRFALVNALTQTCDAYTWRAPRRGAWRIGRHLRGGLR